MDPELQKLGIELGEVALRNSAGAVIDRVRTVKAKKRDRETIAELEEIISGLLSDKTELVRIAQAYEQELIAQKISQADIEYITTNFVPLLKQLIEKGAEQSGDDTETVQEIIDLVQPIVSVETVTVLQLLGFNFRKGIGEPLTRLVAGLIEARAQADVADTHELQRLGLLRETAYLEIARDPDAYARLRELFPQQS